ncbi:nitrate- and nitrite sensing domain-containing protein [Actinomadura atramentaria]|uniref:sensor histidine kinase n=1 Tax=Actinomadura atramentaria TaxID=1990 RepID=UPI00039BBA58|nr:nitrate- and nitrite sensing domain-containing protein [Actinomadura atramentaria]
MGDTSRWRARSVRAKIFLLLFPPLTALIVLWGFAATTALTDSLRQTRAKTFTTHVAEPTDALIAALQDERRMSLSSLGDDATIGRAGFDAQRAATGRVRDAFRRAAADPATRGATRDETRERMTRLARALDDLDALRQAVDHRSIDRTQAMTRYSALIDLAADVYDDVPSSDRQVVRNSRMLISLERGREQLAREDALVTGVLAAGRMTEAERIEVIRLSGAREALYEEASHSLSGPDAVRYRSIVAGPDAARFEELEARVVRRSASGAVPAVDVGAWHTATEAVGRDLSGLATDIRTVTTDRAGDTARTFLLRLWLAGGLGLVAVVTALVLAVRVGRTLIRESRRLARDVSAFAAERLPGDEPSAPEGERPGIAAPETPDEPAYTTTEIRRIGDAFAEARRAVERSAANEEAAHRRLNDVFVTLARRNQSLLQRLLRMLETMQRRTERPEELEALFALDHLATRMRRHAEGLVVLSGRPAGRTWRDPVRMVDVARAAAAEVEDYTRVDVAPMGRTALRGSAVADTIHLLAELIENATTFSPPTTTVRVTGELVGRGFAVEIEDGGLGLAPDELAACNELLATDPGARLGDTTRLGLFVVARLAARLGARVTLRSSAYGGVTAIVLLPLDIVVGPPPERDVPRETDAGLPARRRQTHLVEQLRDDEPALLASAPEPRAADAADWHGIGQHSIGEHGNERYREERHGRTDASDAYVTFNEPSPGPEPRGDGSGGD